MKSTTDLSLIIIVVTYIIFSLFYFLSAYISNSTLPAEANLYLDWLSKQPMSPVEYMVYWISMVGYFSSILAAIGLIFAIKSSKYIFLISIVILLGGSLFVEIPLLITGYQNFIESVAALLAGMILAISFRRTIS